MAAKTELGLICTDIEEKAVGSPVRIMTRSTIALLDRRVNNFLLPHLIMALGTESRALLRQFKTFYPLDGMLCHSLNVAGKALSIRDRLVLRSKGGNGLMAICRHTGSCMNFD